MQCDSSKKLLALSHLWASCLWTVWNLGKVTYMYIKVKWLNLFQKHAEWLQGAFCSMAWSKKSLWSFFFWHYPACLILNCITHWDITYFPLAILLVPYPVCQYNIEVGEPWASLPLQGISVLVKAENTS